MSSLGYRLAAIGSALGMLAGAVQLLVGDEIPDWTGNKLHPVQLGLITIALSMLAFACAGYLERNRGAAAGRRALATLAIVVAAGICFTTVGRLWYVPGPLLLIAAALLWRDGSRA